MQRPPSPYFSAPKPSRYGLIPEGIALLSRRRPRIVNSGLTVCYVPTTNIFPKVNIFGVAIYQYSVIYATKTKVFWHKAGNRPDFLPYI